MTIDVNATFSSEQVKKEGIGIVDMYILNASPNGFYPLYFINYNQNVIGFHLNVNENLTASTEIYTGLPITREAIKTNIDGDTSGISISIPNVDRTIESYIQHKRYLRGCDIYCLTAFTKHLPSGADAGHIGESPDRYAVLKEKLYIDTVSSNENVVSFVCRPKFIIRNKMLPGRTFTRECSWASKGRYAGIECSPQNQINATRLASYPTCDGTIDNCTERKNLTRYGGFPSVPDKGIAII